MTTTTAPSIETLPPRERDRLAHEKLYAVAAEFDNVDDVMAAATDARRAGFKRFDVLSPFPIHGIDDAIGIKPTILPWIVLICGLTGLATALTLTTVTMATSWDLPQLPFHGPQSGYPYLISGKPYQSLPAWIPVCFELTILFSAFGAVFGQLLLNKLPMLYHPVFKHPALRRATQDRFFLVIQADDPRFRELAATDFLNDMQPLSVQRLAE